MIGWMRRRKLKKLRERKQLDKIKALSGKSMKYCSDGKRHSAIQNFTNAPGAWKCHRCGTCYSQVGVFAFDFVDAGTVGACEKFDREERPQIVNGGEEDGKTNHS